MSRSQRDLGCVACPRAAYRLAELELRDRVLKVPFCAECFLMFSAFPDAFPLSRLVGTDDDRAELRPLAALLKRDRGD